MKICLLVIDCLRPDHLGCYGYNRNTSPYTDKIAQNGLVFSNTYAQANWTYPSVYSMMTGRYPSILELSWFDQKINPAFPVLPEVLASHGYKTAIFSPFSMLLNRDTFCSHFDEMQSARVDSNALDNLTTWLGNYDDSFLMFHVGEYVHEPFQAEEELVDLFLDSSTRPDKAKKSRAIQVLTSKTTTGNDLRKIIGNINKHLTSLSKNDLSYLTACYDAGIRKVDGFIRDVHSLLKGCGDDYLFMLLADHGQSFMEHGFFGHGNTVYDEVVKVPLVVDFPGCKAARISDNIQLMDIYPTILEHLQVEMPQEVDGTSFAKALKNEQLTSRTAFSEGYPYVSFRQGDHKIISSYSKFWDRAEVSRLFSTGMTKSRLRDALSLYQRFRPAKMFNLHEDPLETNNIRAKHPDLAAEYNNNLGAILDSIRHNSLSPTNIPIDENIQKQLEKLGYL